MNQCERVIAHLESGRPLDADSAKKLYGIGHLSSRITDIVGMGYRVEKSWQRGRNRFGEPVRWMEYRFPKKED